MAEVLGVCLLRPNPLTPFPAREGGKFGGVLRLACEWSPKRGGPKAHEGGGMGMEGAKPLGGGFWGCPPKKP